MYFRDGQSYVMRRIQFAVSEMGRGNTLRSPMTAKQTISVVGIRSSRLTARGVVAEKLSRSKESAIAKTRERKNA